MTDIDVFTAEQIAEIGMCADRVPSSNDLFVRYDDHQAALSSRPADDPSLWRFWNDKACSLAEDNAKLRKIIADNWKGKFWRAVDHHEAEEVNAALKKEPTK